MIPRSWRRGASSVFLFVVVVGTSFPDTEQANRYRSQAEGYLKSNDVTQAAAFAEKAMQADPGNGSFDFYAAYIYLYRTTDRARALELLQNAERKGYVTGLVYHRMGMCCFHLGDYEAAVAYLERSIGYNKDRLLEADRARDSSRVNSLKREIADSYVWLTKQYEALYEPSKFLEAVEEGLAYNPKDQWLPGLSAKMILPAAHQAFAEGRYDLALERYRRARTLGVKWDWLDDIIAIVEQCKSKPPARPVAVHRIGVIYVTQTRLTTEAGQVVVSPDVTAAQKKKARESQRVFREIVELFSEGRFSVAFAEVDASLSIAEPSLLRRAHPDNLDLEEFFCANMSSFDTFVTMSNTESPYFGEGNFGGSRRYPYVNGVSYGPARGMVMLGGNTGFGTLLHEFFHTIENLAGIGPAHGWRFAEQFPGWKGSTELDFYRWHFATTLRELGFDKLCHTSRHPAPALEPAALGRVRDAYAGIPLADRHEANALALEAEQAADRETAFRLYGEALALSPYQPRALEFMISRSGRGNDATRTREYQERLADISAISDYYPIYDFYHFLRELKSGVTMGHWSKEKITTRGSELSWDAGRFIESAGTYHVTFLFTGGQKAVTIEGAALYENGRLLSRDAHEGWSGNTKRDIVYKLKVEARKPGASCVLRARLRGEGGTDSAGDVLLRRVGD